MIIYDYSNEAIEVELPDKPILAIHVTILSGDETGSVVFSDGQIIEFDASDCRLMGFHDGSYSVTGENVQKWLNFKPTTDGTASYDRLDYIMECAEDEVET